MTKAPDAAEEAVATRLRDWGFEVERLAVRYGRKTADFRAQRDGEVWVLDVKARQADREVEGELKSKGTVTTHRHPHGEKQYNKQ